MHILYFQPNLIFHFCLHSFLISSHVTIMTMYTDCSLPPQFLRSLSGNSVIRSYQNAKTQLQTLAYYSSALPLWICPRWCPQTWCWLWHALTDLHSVCFSGLVQVRSYLNLVVGPGLSAKMPSYVQFPCCPVNFGTAPFLVECVTGIKCNTLSNSTRP